jgi:hypothetical protein
MSRLYLLRCTPDGLAARKAFSSERVRVLSAIIEDGAQFRDTRARRRLGPELRWWAYCWIGERDAALPYPERKQVHLRRRDLSEREKEASPLARCHERSATFSEPCSTPQRKPRQPLAMWIGHWRRSMVRRTARSALFCLGPTAAAKARPWLCRNTWRVR